VNCINGTAAIGGINNTLNDDMIDFLMNSHQDAINHYTFLNSEGCSEESQNAVILDLLLDEDPYLLLEVDWTKFNIGKL
tara:strand:- start:197 stop:433 length:237 start_codon:yes stop_codon:yes gene_type:complete